MTTYLGDFSVNPPHGVDLDCPFCNVSFRGCAADPSCPRCGRDFDVWNPSAPPMFQHEYEVLQKMQAAQVQIDIMQAELFYAELKARLDERAPA